MLQAVIANGGAANQMLYWSRPVNWKDQALTPNPNTIYFNPFYDTTKGPVVLEIPPVEDKESNWLPAPNGSFSLYIRAYWADKPILDGQWKPPVVTRVQ